MRRWFAHAVALALLLPALLVLLPQPSLSAEAALGRDLVSSVCGKDGPQQNGQGPLQHAGHDHCMACGTTCSGCGPSLSSAMPAFATIPPSTGSPEIAPRDAMAPPLKALLDSRPPRGPPARA